MCVLPLVNVVRECRMGRRIDPWVPAIRGSRSACDRTVYAARKNSTNDDGGNNVSCSSCSTSCPGRSNASSIRSFAAFRQSSVRQRTFLDRLRSCQACSIGKRTSSNKRAVCLVGLLGKSRATSHVRERCTHLLNWPPSPLPPL